MSVIDLAPIIGVGLGVTIGCVATLPGCVPGVIHGALLGAEIGSVIASGKHTFEAAYGHDPITGEKADVWHRLLAGAEASFGVGFLGYKMIKASIEPVEHLIAELTATTLGQKAKSWINARHQTEEHGEK